MNLGVLLTLSSLDTIHIVMAASACLKCSQMVEAAFLEHGVCHGCRSRYRLEKDIDRYGRSDAEALRKKWAHLTKNQKQFYSRLKNGS